MRVACLIAKDELRIEERASPRPSAGEAVVTLRAAALNRRDIWVKQGSYAGLVYPCVPGSDGAGVVSAVGEGVGSEWIGRDVVINPALDWGPREAAQGRDFSILGLPCAGTLAEQVVVPVGQLASKPEHLSWEQAAALPLAGLTAFRGLVSRAAVQPDERVLITGIGGGVAQLALVLARALRARVWVTSSRADPLAQARKLGAEGGFDYTQSVWVDAAKAVGGFDVILDSAGGDGVNTLIEIAAPGARLVFSGATLGNPSHLALRKVFWRQLSLLGTTMGSPADWTSFIAFVNEHRVIPPVGAVYPLEHVGEAFSVLERGTHNGKLVVRMA